GASPSLQGPVVRAQAANVISRFASTGTGVETSSWLFSLSVCVRPAPARQLLVLPLHATRRRKTWQNRSRFAEFMAGPKSRKGKGLSAQVVNQQFGDNPA